MIYEDLAPISREDAERLVVNGSIEDATSCLIRVALHEQDQKWAEELLLRALNDDRSEVRSAAVTGLGHLARIHRKISNTALESLRSLQEDSLLGGVVEDALEDILMFVEPRAQS